MKNEQLKNVFIGLFVLAGLGIIVWVILFLNPSLGDEKQLIKARFSNVDQINVGTRVTFAGRAVGKVRSIDQVHVDRQTAGEVGRIYPYQLTLAIDSQVKVYDSDEITVHTSGLLGERSVAIIPRAPLEGKTAQLLNNKVLYARSTDPLEETVNQLVTLSTKASAMIDHIIIQVDSSGPELQQALKTIDKAGQRIDSTLTELQQLNLWGNLGSLSSNLNHLSQNILEGKGSLGRLVSGDELYLRMISIMSKVETLMNDINHYGLLFNDNRDWQKLRLRRMNLISRIKTPDQFQVFFDEEMDIITTSLSRVSELMNQTYKDQGLKSVLKSKEFRQEFVKLMGAVDYVDGSLKLYNQELIEAQKTNPPLP